MTGQSAAPQLFSKKYTLDNGVRVLVEELPHVHSAAIGFWVDTGTRNEDDRNNGISHFIEHMLFKGTQTRSALEIAQALEDTGGSLNAFTDKEMTCYYARVLDDQVELAIDVLADMLLNSTFEEAEMKREKKVVIEEIKMYEDAPDELLQDIFNELVYGDHPLHRAIVGTRSTVRGLTREAIADYMDRYYTPDRIVVSVAGNVDSKKVVKQVEKLLGKLDRKPTRSSLSQAEPVGVTKVRFKDTEQAHVLMGTHGRAIGHDDRWVQATLESILGGGMSSRLFQEVREKRGLAYSISSFVNLYREAGIFGIYAGTNPKSLDDVIDLSLAEVAKIKRDGVTADELRRAKQQMRGNLLLSLELPGSRMRRMARNELYFGRFIAPAETIAGIEAVTLDHLGHFANELFRPGTITTTVVGPVRRIRKPALLTA